jgi:enoyl reductase-like protein
MRIVLLFLFLIQFETLFAQADSAMVVPFTLADKIRLIRIEERMETKFHEIDNRFAQIDKRFEQIDKRFEQIDKRFEQIERRLDRLEDLFFNTTLILLGSMLTLIGFILWDRRTFLKPIENQLNEIREQTLSNHEKTEKIIQLLKERALYDEQLKELLKKHNLI